MSWVGEKKLRIIWGLELIPTGHTCPQVQDAACAGCGTHILASVCNVHQTLRVEVSTSKLIPELILSQKCRTVYVHMGPTCNGC